jgi:tRNA-binding EMAP/Myf-like protein
MGGETYVCEYSTRKGYPIWVKFVEDLENNVCDSVGDKKIMEGETYVCEYSTRKGYPIWVKSIGGSVEDGETGCWEWEYSGNVYRNVDSIENRLRCDNGVWIPSRDYSEDAEETTCGQFESCNSYNLGDLCINAEGLIFECQYERNGIGKFFKEVVVEESPTESIREVSVKRTVTLSPGSRCGEDNFCICSSTGDTLNSWEYCPEASRDCSDIYMEVSAGTAYVGLFNIPIEINILNLLGVGVTNQSQNIKKVKSTDTLSSEGMVCSTSSLKYTCQGGTCSKYGSSSMMKSDDFGNREVLGLYNSLISKIEASEGDEDMYIFDPVSGFLTSIPLGTYIFEHEGDLYSFQINNSSDNILIYIDENNDETYDESIDTKVSDIASEINIIALKQSYDYELTEGFNFVSFPYLISNEDSRTAAGLLTKLNEVYDDAFYSISKFDGRWKIVGQNAEVYDNNDFQLLPGEGYMIKAKRDIDISIVGQPVQFETEGDKSPIYMTEGWNLIGLYGTGVKTYTAKSMIADINASNFTADNVTKWARDKQMYEGFQFSENQEYGFDFPINSLESYFVRILEGRGNWQPKLGTQ